MIAEHHGDQPLNRLLKQTFFDPLEARALPDYGPDAAVYEVGLA